MSAATVVGLALTFGITANESSLTTQSVSISHRKDKKEVRDVQGAVVSVAYYNTTTSMSIRGVGASGATVGTALTISGGYSVAGTTYIDEVSIDYSNEDFVSSAISATSYEEI